MVENENILKNFIYGYQPHKIYAFSTPRLPHYLKVGETGRNVGERLAEWQQKIPDLYCEREWAAMVPKDVIEATHFFQDHALHKYFKENGYEPMESSNAPGHSKEFYPVDLAKIEEGISYINEDYDSNYQKYRYVNIQLNKKVKRKYNHSENYSLRKNQQQVVDSIVNAVNDEKLKEKKLLLFAVMRFGKTFVALEAAKKINARLIVVVSAKADVENEWQHGVESHNDFKNFTFLKKDSLVGKPQRIHDELLKNHVVLFLTLQDLSGKKIKETHRELFNQEIDFLIVDESHFGARAQKYGEVLYKDNSARNKYFKVLEEDDIDNVKGNIELKGLDNAKALHSKVTLHLSGTPYRILMGNEFDDPRQVVGMITFEDILDAKGRWYKENPQKKEWKNPYFGFPQMVRFAFNLNDNSRRSLIKLKERGSKDELNELFGPVSNDPHDKNHLKFKYENDVFNILKAIDGTGKSSTIFPILNYPRIKEGRMAQHVVIVLPYKASCDAMAILLNEHKNDFLNLNNYKIINIAGHDGINNTSKVESMIHGYAQRREKTISITVNKMLTGVTIPEWDTMLYMKDTQSPQEYDQAIYRLQSPYVSTEFDDNKNIINKEDLKPQTLLVDFSPNRMMSVEQYKAFVLAASKSKNEYGNEKVKEYLNRQMMASPIITIENNKLKKIEPTDIMKYVAAYSSEKGISEEASEIGVDLSILENDTIKNVIDRENEINSKDGIKFEEYQKDNSNQKKDIENFHNNDRKADGGDKTKNFNDTIDSENERLKKKVQNYYLRILFYAFLSTDSNVNNLSDVWLTYDNNERLATHLGIDKKVIREFQLNLTNPWIRSVLDNKISNANALSADRSVKSDEKVSRAIQSFKRISENEVFTPRKIAEMMVDNLMFKTSLDNFNLKKHCFIDLSSKSGIFPLVLLEKLIQKGVDSHIAKQLIYCVTTSPAAYEFTRKVYTILGLPVKHIMDVDSFTSFDLIKLYRKNKVNLNKILNYGFFKGDKNMKFDVVVGNPPYQDENKGKNHQAAPIYEYFYDLAESLGSKYILISPARFLSNQGGTKKSWNEKMLNDNHIKVCYFNSQSKQVFPGTDIKGGVVILYRDEEKKFEPIVTFIPISELKSVYNRVELKSNRYLSDFVFSPDSYRFTDLLFSENPFLIGRTDKSHSKAVASSVFSRYSEVFLKNKPKDGGKYIQIYGRLDGERVYRFIKRKYVVQHDNLDKWKVFVPGASGTGKFGETIPSPVIGKPAVGHNQTFVSLGKFNTEFEAYSLVKYIKTKFCRAMLGIMKTTQNNQSKNTWSKVPMQDFTQNSDIDWTKGISEIDQQLYEKYCLNKNEELFIENNVKGMC